jgi:HAD superfamily hydrolase (TIGR01549 family)
MKKKCVIFDLDGVLVDTVNAWLRIHREAVKKFVKNPPSEKEIDRLVYTPTSEFVDRMLPEGSEDREKISSKMHDYIQDRMENTVMLKSIKEKEGAKHLLLSLKQEKIKIGIVTNNERRLAEKMLESSTLIDFLDVIVTKDDVLNTKPHPEPLLKALMQLNCKSEDCLFLGDTEADVIAGKAAGVVTALIDSKVSKDLSVEPDYKINKLMKVLTLVSD